MAIARRSRAWPGGWQELEEMTNRLNRVFDDLPAIDGGERSTWLPPVNIEETKDELVLTVELPGMGHEDIEIGLENNLLTIRGEKQHEREEGE